MAFAVDQWVKVAINSSWTYVSYRAVDNHSHSRYSSSLIFGLYRVTCLVSYPERVERTLWCGLNESTSALSSEDIFNSKYGMLEPTITPIVQQRIKDWIAKQIQPVEPEPTPDPIDEGNGLIDGLWDTLKAWIKEAILAGLAFLEQPLNIINTLISKLSQTISSIVDAVKNAISTVMAKVVSMFDTVVQKIKGVIDKVWENIELVWMTLKDMFDTVKQAIVIAFEKSWTFIKETFTTLWDKMKSGLTYIGEQIVAGLKYLWDKIKDALNWVWDILNNAYKAIVDAVTAVWDRFKDRLTETIESIKEAFGDVVERLIVWWESYMDWRDKNTENLINWTEEKMVETIKFMLKAQRKVLEELAKEGV